MKKILFAILLAISFNANALKFEAFSIENDPTIAIVVTGRFTDGDYEKFKKFMVRYKGKAVIVALDSIGGNVKEGMWMGAYFYDNDLPVTVANTTDTEAQCLSACSMAYFSAKRKLFTRNSVIGVHRFYKKDTYTRGARTSAQQAEDKKEMQSWMEIVYKYAELTDIHPEVIEITFKTPSTSMYYFNRRQLEKYGARYVD